MTTFARVIRHKNVETIHETIIAFTKPTVCEKYQYQYCYTWKQCDRLHEWEITKQDKTGQLVGRLISRSVSQLKKNEWKNERMNEWMNEWMNEFQHHSLSTSWRCAPNSCSNACAGTVVRSSSNRELSFSSSELTVRGVGGLGGPLWGTSWLQTVLSRCM